MGALALGTLVIIIGGLLYVKRKSLEFLYNRTYWAIGALVSFEHCTCSSISLEYPINLYGCEYSMKLLVSLSYMPYVILLDILDRKQRQMLGNISWRPRL